MRFSTSFTSINKLAGLAAALMVLPVAVACGTPEAAEDAGSDVTSELPESPEVVEDEVAVDELEEPTDVTAAGESIVDVAAANGSFDTLVAAVQAAGLEETLDADGPYTLFAPTDEAFAALPEGTVEKLVKPENKEALSQVLTYHVVPGVVPASEIEPGAVNTVEGSDVQVGVDPAGVTVNEASVVQPDVVAENGVIHVVDTVLLPPTFDASTLL